MARHAPHDGPDGGDLPAEGRGGALGGLPKGGAVAVGGLDGGTESKHKPIALFVG